MHIFFIYIYIFLVGQDSTGLAGLSVQARDPAGQEILTHAQHITRVIKITGVQCQANCICMHS